MIRQLAIALLAGAVTFACDGGGESGPDDRAPVYGSPDAGAAGGGASADAGASPDSGASADAGGAADGSGAAVDLPEVERIPPHRLNRIEYQNSLEDLLGISLRVVDSLPPDDLGYGYDNNADVLSLSPLHLERYESIATEALAEAMDPRIQQQLELRVPGSEALASTGDASGEGWNLWTNGTLSVTVDPPAAGLYTVGFDGYAQQAGPDPALAALTINGTEVHQWTTPDTGSFSTEFRHEVRLGRGSASVGIAFLNDYYEPDTGADRNLIIDAIVVSGPTDLPPEGETSRDRLFVCAPSDAGDRACAAEIVEAFASRAWRRPADASAVDRMMGLFDQAAAEGATFDEAVELPLRATLLSPRFLFRTLPGAANRPLDDFEVATRLSYFLWSSTPDDALLAAARAGELRTTEQLHAQVDRMLADPRSSALVDNFAGQWLFLRDIANVFPDRNLFPAFNDALRDSMQEESRLFFETFLTEDRSMIELITARETFVDSRLAAHYGIPGLTGDAFARVSLEGLPRRGIMGQAGWLTMTSNPTRTSVVRRGKWVLGQLLCDEPADPPAGVEGLDDPGEGGGTLREVLEQHRADPFCASCHEVMDEIGFALEGFDAIGLVRESDNGEPIDNRGQFPDGTSFHGLDELAEIIAEDERLAECMVEQLTTYALGRGTAFQDRDELLHITEEFAAEGFRLPALARAIVASDMFRYAGASEDMAPEAGEEGAP